MISSIKIDETGAELLYEEMTGKPKGSVVICPGGAYLWLSPREGWPVAREFEKAGYQCYILNYSVGMENAPLGKTPLKQLALAVSKVREIAKDKGNNTFTAVCGFSAGGHLAASLGVHWNDQTLGLGLTAETIRPDAMILSYAVTELHDFDGHELVKCLCGDDEEMFEYLEVAKYITGDTPPSFLWHTVTDEEVSVQASMNFMNGLIRNGVFAELHLYPQGVHGLSLATPAVEDPQKNRIADPHVASWSDQCKQWLDIVNRLWTENHGTKQNL